jgi:ribokinase
MKAVVVGSLNMDLRLSVPELPIRGQTLLSRSLDRSPGGKGANQAVALARLDAQVEMVGAVGKDSDGAALLQALRAVGVSTRFVAERPATPTGLAVVCVDPDGDNAIIVAPGANASLGPDDVHAAAAALDRADLLLLQLEIPLESVLVAARLGTEHGALVVLNAAPATMVPGDVVASVGVLVVNQGEARRLRERGPGIVVVTLGGDGCVVADERGVASLPAYPAPVVDTTGAGDCFAAAFGFGLAEGRSPGHAARLASAAAALAVGRQGAQAMPSRVEIEHLIGR